MRLTCPRLVIAGTNSGVGKTSISIALTRALTRRNLKVQTFKVGPDYLDPSYLALASGRPCYNLDGWMMGKDYVCQLFSRHAERADLALIEGVMGLFDGAGPASAEGSTAEIARWLEAPVLLVTGGQGMARSLAALVHGYASFEPALRLGAVIANRCGSERHGDYLTRVLEAASLPPLLGAIPRGGLGELPSRHLGLVAAQERGLPPGLLDELARAIEDSCQVEEILTLARSAPALPGGSPTADSPTTRATPKRVRIGLAWDSAFHFYYQDLLDEMKSRGAELVLFSPLEDRVLPENLQGLYLGGGYPEEHARALSGNREMTEQIRQFAASDRPVYAECGGLMYLSLGVETRDGGRWPMVGLFPGWTRMAERWQALGYVEATLATDSLWGEKGSRLRGHEFHYSEWVGDPNPDWPAAYALRRERSGEIVSEGFHQGKILASYAHLHYASRPEAVERFVNQCGGVS